MGSLEVGLVGAGALAVTHVHFTPECLCLPCTFVIFLSSKMARRRDSAMFSSGKTHSRVPTIFFSSYNSKLN